MLWSTVKLPLSIVMWFRPSKTLLRSSTSCGCETFRVIKFLLSILLLYTHPCHMILSKQKFCILLNDVSTESQTRPGLCTSDKTRFSQTRNWTRIHVGLALSYVKLLLSSWKKYTCTLMAWYTNKYWRFKWALTVLNFYTYTLYFSKKYPTTWKTYHSYKVFHL